MGSSGVQYVVLYFLFYILTIFLKQHQTHLILFCSLMTLVLSLQILVHGAFRNSINEVFREINELFQSNLLSLNYEKTYFLQFVTKKNQEVNIQYLLETNT